MSKNPETLTENEQTKLLDRLANWGNTTTRQKASMRNYTMALLMLDAGLRVGEVVQMTGRNLMFNCAPVTSIIVAAEITKSKRERQIPVTQRLSEAIKKMHVTIWSPDINLNIPFAFYQLDKEQPITTRQVERIIKKAAIETIGRPVNPHMLRHTFATKLMRITSVRVVQELLGHRNLSSTQIYTHPNQDDFANAIRQLDPTAC